MVVPNSGYPNIIRNKVTFSDNPEYFAHKVRDITNLPVNIVGGCCGTNPEFIRQLSAIANLDPVAITKKNLSRTTQLNSKVCKGFFCNSDGSPKSKKLIAVELAPPANTNDEKLLAAAKSLKESNVDVLTFPDSPSGRTRIDSVLMAQKVKQATGMTVMPHICCRDKNAIAMRSLFLGAYINDINNMLIITGDPIPTMARQTVKSVFNFDSVGLMKIAQEMNEDTFVNSPLSYGGAINQGRNRLDLEINRVKKKMAAGAEFFLTQPVFSKDSADRVRKIKEETNARILVGIMPLISKKNAIFMKNEIAGVQVTDEVVSLYSENATKEQGEAVGISLAKNIISFTEDFADGYYFSFPFNRVHMLKKILDKD
jgi:homocysteine S-methyltransferase